MQMAANKHEDKHEGEGEEEEEGRERVRGHDSPRGLQQTEILNNNLQDEGRSKHRLNIYNWTDDDTRGAEEEEKRGSREGSK